MLDQIWQAYRQLPGGLEGGAHPPHRQAQLDIAQGASTNVPRMAICEVVYLCILICFFVFL